MRYIAAMINVYNQGYIKAFGKRLRELREKKNLSQRKLAEIAGIKYSQIGRIERGEQNTSISTIYVLAKSLEIGVSDFFDFPYSE